MSYSKAKKTRNLS